MLPQFDEGLNQLLHVGHVEVPRNQQVSRHPVVLSMEGVAFFDGVIAVGSVANVAQKQFAEEGSNLLHGLCVFCSNGSVLGCHSHLFRHLGKDVLYWCFLDGALPIDVAGAGSNVEFDGANSGAVLPAVDLFLHENVQNVEAVPSRPVFMNVVFERF